LYDAHAPPNSKLSDYVIPSYTPTLTALLNASKTPSTPISSPDLLLIGEPSSLPGVEREVKLIEQEFEGRGRINYLIGHDATIERVQEKMHAATWVHFACHGIQNASHPTESALLLTGGSRLTLSHITGLNLPKKEMAFLSACQTAKGDEKLSDEAVHLAGGMLAAGFRGVIATMWSVNDGDAPRVAKAVYGHLLNKDTTPDAANAAAALASAVGQLRDVGNASFISWVPFIHLGA
jgi:CHAT domain-containing protein